MLQVQPGTQIGQHCLPERRVIDATHPALFDDGPTRDNGTLNMQSIRPDQHAAQYRYTGKHPVFHQMTGSDQRQFRRTASDAMCQYQTRTQQADSVELPHDLARPNATAAAP